MRICLALIIATAAAGCSREVTYRAPSGETFTYRADGMSTKLGKGTASIRKPDGTRIEVTLENYDGQSQGLIVAGKALDVAAGLAARAK